MGDNPASAQGDVPTGAQVDDPIKALGAKLDAFIEATRPKPQRSDRDLLEEVAAGLKALPQALSDALKGTTSTGTPPPDPRPADKPAGDEPRKAPGRRPNPWTAHRR